MGQAMHKQGWSQTNASRKHYVDHGVPAEIPNSPEDIATPTPLRSHRILFVIKIPLGDPKGALGETRPW